jgi:hypothetical protein
MPFCVCPCDHPRAAHHTLPCIAGTAHPVSLSSVRFECNPSVLCSSGTRKIIIRRTTRRSVSRNFRKRTLTLIVIKINGPTTSASGPLMNRRTTTLREVLP